MLKTTLKYHGWTEAVQVKSVTGAAGEAALQNVIDTKRKAPYAVVSFVSNQITQKSLHALSRKLNFWAVQIGEEFTATTSWKSGNAVFLTDRSTKYVPITTPWTTMLGVFTSVLTDRNVGDLTIVYDEEYESLAKQLPIEIRKNTPVQLIMLGSPAERRAFDAFCSRGTFASKIVIMADSITADRFLGKIANCSNVLDKYVFTKDCLSSSDLTSYADVLWIRPHFVNIPACVDEIISWTMTAGLQNGLFIIGRELEIAFYDDIARLVGGLTDDSARNDSISETVYACLLKKPTMNKFCNESKCDGMRLFGIYHETANGIFQQDVSLRLYRIICNERQRETFLVANWTTTSGLRKFYKVGLTKDVANLRHYRVVTYMRAPFVYRRDFENGSWIYYGYCIDILDALSRSLNFTYEIYEVEDGEYGRKNSIGRMNGLAAELFSGDANIALASFVPTAEREALVDFSCPFHEVTGLAVLLKDHARESAIALLTIATWHVWLAVIAAFLITGLLISAFDYLSPFSDRNNHESYGHSKNPLHTFTIAESFWFCLTSCSLQGKY
ncbi:hypothetical protein D918_07079 [Trichuris suis]|nr:hypothetical protein D918_07079 [Trichuris suis]